MPKQTKITDSFFKSKASSSSSSSLSLNDNVSNNFGLLLPIDDVIDENNILDTFINSAINGGVKRNWNIQQLKKTVEDINSEFKPQIEKRTAFWEKEIEKLNNIKTTIRKSSSQLDIDSGDKSQKTLLDYFTKNEKSSQNESNITTIVLESQDVPQDLVIPMLDPRTSDLNITTTNSGTLQFNNTSNTISNNNTLISSNNNINNSGSGSSSSAGTGTIINTTSEIVNPPSNINENIIITPNNTAINNTNNIGSSSVNIITTSTSSDFLDEEDIIKPITPGSEMMNTMENEIINLNSNDLDDLLMEDIIQVPSILNVVAPETTVKTSEPTSSSPSLSNTSSSSSNTNNTTNATVGTIASNVVNTTTPGTASTTAVVNNNTMNANSTTISSSSSSTNNNTSNTANSINTTISIINPTTNQITTNQTISNTFEKSPNLEETSIEETLTTPKKTTRKTTSSKKSTASKKTSKKGSKKRKVQDDDAMLDDDDEYKPSLTDEEDLILDEEIEEDESLENVGKSGKRKRPASKKVVDEDESLNLLDEEDESIESKSTNISESNKSTSKTTNKSTSNSTTISNNNNTITNNTITTSSNNTSGSSSTSNTSNTSGSKSNTNNTNNNTNNNSNTSSMNVKEEDDEDEEEIIETPIKTRSSARKKTRNSGKTIDTDIHQIICETTTGNKSSSKTSNTIGSTTPTSIGNNDIFEESINQSPMDDSNEPQTPANTKKKKRTTTTVRRRKKKPSEDGTVSSNYQSDHIDGDSFLSHEDELFVSTNSNTDTSAPSYQFWDYVNSFFPVIKRDRLQLLEIEHSDDDDAFSISKRGKHYTEKWEDENCKLFPHLFKKDQSSPMDHESTNLNTTNTSNTSNTSSNTTSNTSNGINLSSFSNLINVDKGSKQFFSQHNLTQRLLSSLIEERDLVSVDTFSNDNENSNHSLVFDSDEESVDESSRKTTRSTRKSTSGNVAHYSSNVFSSPSLNNNTSSSTSNNINSMLDNFSNSFSILEQQQQHEISEHLKQKLPQLSKTHNQKSNHVLQASNQFKDFEQQLFEPSFDYSTQYLNLFEEKLMSEIKSIGLLSPELQICDPLWIDEESREDDEICAEIRTLQNKLRQQMEKTNTFRMKILNTVKEKLHEETEIGKKILLFSDMEKKLFPPTQKKR